jgi:hypothetical protein
MDSYIAQQWTAALRSGEYEQGTGALNKDGKYCCLGVLCDLFDRANPGELEVTERSSGAIAYNGDSSLPSATVLNWAGLTDEYGSVMMSEQDRDGYSIEIHLTELNDGTSSMRSLTFNEIADVIDYFVEEL